MVAFQALKSGEFHFNLGMSASWKRHKMFAFLFIYYFFIYLLFIYSQCQSFKVYLRWVKSLWRNIISLLLCQNSGIPVIYSTIFSGAKTHQFKCWFSSFLTPYGALLNHIDFENSNFIYSLQVVSCI